MSYLLILQKEFFPLDPFVETVANFQNCIPDPRFFCHQLIVCVILLFPAHHSASADSSRKLFPVGLSRNLESPFF
jgi:hypothetical protein